MKKKDVYIKGRVHTWTTNLGDINIGFVEMIINPETDMVRGSTYHYVKEKNEKDNS